MKKLALYFSTQENQNFRLCINEDRKFFNYNFISNKVENVSYIIQLYKLSRVYLLAEDQIQRKGTGVVTRPESSPINNKYQPRKVLQKGRQDRRYVRSTLRSFSDQGNFFRKIFSIKRSLGVTGLSEKHLHQSTRDEDETVMRQWSVKISRPYVTRRNRDQ